MTEKKWPNDFPTDITVPPEEATEIEASLYRCVHNEPPDINDFLPSYKDPSQCSLAIRNPKIKKKPQFYATSFYDNFDSIKSLLEESPNRFKNQFIVVGAIMPTHGKGSEPNTKHHISFWFYDGVYPEGFKRYE